MIQKSLPFPHSPVTFFYTHKGNCLFYCFRCQSAKTIFVFPVQPVISRKRDFKLCNYIVAIRVRYGQAGTCLFINAKRILSLELITLYYTFIEVHVTVRHCKQVTSVCFLHNHFWYFLQLYTGKAQTRLVWRLRRQRKEFDECSDKR